MVRFAPLRIPLERRVQTAAVVFMLAVPLCTALAAVGLLLHPLTRPAFLAYVLWTLTLDRATPSRGGRVVRALRRLPVWIAVAQYFPTRLVMTRPLDGRRPHVLAVHPHGLVSLGVVTGLVMDALRGGERLGGLDYRVGTVRFNMAAPLWREVLMAMGFVDAGRPSLDACLRGGLSVVLVPGGALEALYARPGSADLVLERRKGFVRLALAHGAPLCPCYVFGETEAYDQVPNPPGSWVRAAQDAVLRATGFTLPLPMGRGVFQYDFGVLPRRAPLTVVVGPPLELGHAPDPTPQQVDAAHAAYVEALRALYEEHAPRLASPAAAGPGGVGDGAPSPHPPLRLVR